MKTFTQIILLVKLIFSSKSTERLPLYVGVGYDLAFGNPHSDKQDPGFRSNIFEFTFNNNQTTEDGKFLIPDKFISRNKFSCAYTASASEFTGVKSYQEELKSSVSISSSINAFMSAASFSASMEFTRIHNITTTDQSILIQSGAECEVYSLEMPIFDTISLSSDFKKGVLLAFKGKIGWDRIFEVFGTSFIYSAVMGGRTHLYHEINKHSYQELKSTGLDIKFTAKLFFAKWSADINTDYQSFTTEINLFEKKVDKTQEIYIGGKPPKSGKWIDWQNLVLNMPAPISYRITSISDLFTIENFPELSEKEIEDMTKQFEQSELKYCTDRKCLKPDPDRPFPPNVKKIDYQYPEKGFHFHPFDDKPSSDPMMIIRKFIIRSARVVDSIQLMLSNGLISFYTPAHGGSGGYSSEWEVPENEGITQIFTFVTGYCYNFPLPCIGAIQFSTNKGTKSPIFGSADGPFNMEMVRGQVTSIYGSTTSYLSSIGFYSAEIIYPDEEKIIEL